MTRYRRHPFTAGIAMLTVLALASRAVQPNFARMPRSFLALALTVLSPSASRSAA